MCKQDDIFISIASFIDPDLRNTILSCIHQAKYPERLVFGINLQYNSEIETNFHCIDDLVEKYNIRIKKFWFEDSEGGCWARNEISYLYDNEPYVLQLDAHTRLVRHWDELLIQQINTLPGKPIISYLSPPFFRNKELGIDYEFKYLHDPYIINIPTIKSITQEYWPVYTGYTNEQHTQGASRQVSLLYAGFIFTTGEWIRVVRNDPKHYYTGEEFALSIRSYTHGYDIYQPIKILSWHMSNPNHKNHYHVFDNHNEKHKRAVEQLKNLIFEKDLGEYGLGSVRTIEEYEKFSKINIKNREVYL
jgi:hypothetical protein